MSKDTNPEFLPPEVADEIFWTGHATFKRDGNIIHICYIKGCPEAEKGTNLHGTA